MSCCFSPPSWNQTCSLTTCRICTDCTHGLQGIFDFDQCSKVGKQNVETWPCLFQGGGMGRVSFFFFLFYKQLPCRFLVVPSWPGACIIAAIVFVLSDHSNVSLVNTFFLFSIFLYFFAFCFISVLYFSMPCPLKEKKKRKKSKLSFPVVPGQSVCWCSVPDSLFEMFWWLLFSNQQFRFCCFIARKAALS